MKILKLNSTPEQTTSQGILDNYYFVQDSHVLNGEDDMTNVETLYIFSSSQRFDYGVFRDSLNTHMIPKWAEMEFDDRKKCIQHYKYPVNLDPAEWASYYSEAEHERNWNIVTIKTRACRLQRLFAAFQKISYRLTQQQVAMVYMTSKTILMDYYYANLPHLLFWIQNAAYPPMGIDYTANGFAQMDGFSTQLMHELLDILNNGNYENVDNETIDIKVV